MIAAACRVARADVTAVASTVCKMNIRERLLRRDVGSVDAVAEQVVRRYIEARAQNASDAHPLNNIDDIIRQTAAIWEPGRIAGDQAQTLALPLRGRRDTGVESHKVGDRPCWSASGGNRWGISHQRQKIGSRWSGYFEPIYGIEHSSNKGIKVERSELAVVDRL